MKRGLTMLLVALAASSQAWSHDYKAGTLEIGHPFARSTVPGAKVGGAYLSLANKGRVADRLVRASSPRAGAVELHAMSVEGKVMRMRQVPGIEVAPGATVKLAPGGWHIMLIDLKQPLSKGDRFPMTLVFERAGEVQVDVVVEDAAAGAAKASQEHHH